MGTKDIVAVIIAFALGAIGTWLAAPSFFQASTATVSQGIAQEISTIRMAALMWVANKSTTGDFTGVEADVIGGSGNALPDFTVSGTGASSTLTSRVATGVTYTLAPASGNKGFTITVNGLGTYETLTKSNTLKLPATITDTSTSDGILSYAFNG